MSQFDDQVEAALSRIEADTVEDGGFFGPLGQFKKTSSVLAGLIRNLLTSPFPIKSLASAAPSLVGAWSEDRASRTHEQQIYVVDAIVDKLRSHDSELAEIWKSVEEKANFGKRLSDVMDDTMSAAVPNAESEKLNLLASIAVSGALIYKSDPVEQVSEFLRITTQLSVSDVIVLREINLAQRLVKKQFGPSHQLHELREKWNEVLANLVAKGINTSNSRSAFARLQSHGLIERIEPGSLTNSPQETPYELLDLGERYVDYLSDHNATQKP